MNKEDILDYLSDRKIWYEITEHRAVYNMAEVGDVVLPYPEANAKNLFVYDEKKSIYYLITVKGDQRVDLKKFRKENCIRSLSFASEHDLMEVLGILPGAVTPFGLLNDSEHKVQLFVDEVFLGQPGLIGVHPNDNTATVWLKTEDLISIIKEHGNQVSTVQISNV